MTHFRPFRNGDSPALADLWNRGVPESDAASPLSAFEFDAHVASKPNFEAAGLTVAVREGRIVGFAHAGFGPEVPVGDALHLDFSLGTIGMLVVDPEAAGAEVEAGLIAESQRYLRDRGATVLYAGGQYPLNPFYWGVYGGSEWAGVLSTHSRFLHAVEMAGYEAVSHTVHLEADLSAPEVRDPRGALIRRSARVEVTEDAMPENWWDALAIGSFRPTRFRLLAKADGRELAWATTWDMSWFGRRDGRPRIGLIAMGVDPAFRRKGFGRHLVFEIMRQARSEKVAVVALQTGSTNEAALALYRSLGFVPVGSSILFRLGTESGSHADGQRGESPGESPLGRPTIRFPRVSDG